MSKALFILKIFKILTWLFGFMEKKLHKGLVTHNEILKIYRNIATEKLF